MLDFIVDIGLLLVGFGAFFNGFIQLKKKQTVENVPTSKVRSAAMGFCELSGVAGGYPIKSPVTGVDCVYYKYRIEVREPALFFDDERHISNRSIRKSLHWKTVRDESSEVPFYIKDDTGRIILDPRGAEIAMPPNYRYVEDGDISGEKKRYSEWKIFPGDTIYVLGTVKKSKDIVVERREKFLQRLRELKQDSSRLADFDMDKDGSIDPAEWDRARAHVEQEVLMEEVGEQQGDDDVVIGVGDADRTFIISDRSEEKLREDLGSRVRKGLVIGAVIAVVASVSLLAHTGLLPAFLGVPWSGVYKTPNSMWKIVDRELSPGLQPLEK